MKKFDHSHTNQTSDSVIEYYDDYYTENVNEINTSQRPDDINALKNAAKNAVANVTDNTSPKTAALKKANKNVEREALITDGNYAYYTPTHLHHGEWSPVDPVHHPYSPHPVLLPHPTPSPKD